MENTEKPNKKERKQLYKKFLKESKVERNTPYEILHGFDIPDELIDKSELELIYNKELRRFESKVNSILLTEYRADGDIRNQSDFAVNLYDGDFMLLKMFYTLDMKNRTIDFRKKHINYYESDQYTKNESIIIVFSFLKRLYSGTL